MPSMVACKLLLLLAASVCAYAVCPKGMDELANFTDENNMAWSACEDFQAPSGALALVPSDGSETAWLPKTHELYAEHPDDAYYLGMTKKAALAATEKFDVLGHALLSCNHSSSPETSCFSHRDVMWALPPIRTSGNGGHYDTWEACDGVRTFVGARGTSTDATFSDMGEDCSHNGFPSPLGMLMPGYSVLNWTAVNTGEGPIMDWQKYINFTAVADGLLGGDLPVIVLYFPVLNTNPYHDLKEGSRYWTMIAAPVPDEGGRKEQDVWFKFSQIDCTSKPVNGYGYGACTATSQYWENYWFTRTAGKCADGDAFGPRISAKAGGFFANLLNVHRYWNQTKREEGMMRLSLPETPTTNGTWLNYQATHSLFRSMVNRRDTFHPTYGVSPGYGWQGQDGFQDTFTTTATMALEWGSMPYAKGVIDNQFSFYVRHDGLINYRATEVPTCSRFLTVLALYFSYTGDTDLMLKHFSKAKALADWLLYRREASIGFSQDDPRFGIPVGDDEADSYKYYGGFSGKTNPGSEELWYPKEAQLHHYSSAAEMYRAFAEIGEMWQRIGSQTKRDDISEHAQQLVATAPKLLQDLHASMNRTLHTTPDGDKCWGHLAEARCGGFHTRTFPEMFYSGALLDDQVDDIYRMGAGETNCSGAQSCSASSRFLQVGNPAGGTLMFTHIPFGLAYGLLVADMPDRFLLHYFSASAHSYTRGTWTTPESSFVDRDKATIAYASAGQTIAPMYLRWAMTFEHPRTKTVWICKALPREWLAVSSTAVEASNVPTRYGRLGFKLEGSKENGSYIVRASLELPDGFAPPGGLRLRVRAPLSAGKISSVTVGGAAWKDFDAKAETVDFYVLTPSMSVNDIVVTFDSQ